MLIANILPWLHNYILRNIEGEPGWLAVGFFCIADSENF